MGDAVPLDEAPKVALRASSLAFRDGRFVETARTVPAETAVALSINGSTHAVMMATPSSLGEFAIGLALNEGIIGVAEDVERLEILHTAAGIDCRMWLKPERAAGYVARKRRMAGPVGCGLCGVESLELTARELPVLRHRGEPQISPADVVNAIAGMAEQQVLGRETRAVHAAGFFQKGIGLVAVREDVGRHNALDKVAGYLAVARIDAATGFLTITSRVSVELVQKAAMMGAPLIAAVSAPTALAIATAKAVGITLVGIARGSEFEVFTHPQRIEGAPFRGILSAPAVSETMRNADDQRSAAP